jgi:hypothetical protein
VGPKENQTEKQHRLDNSLKIARREVFREMVQQMGETFVFEANLDEHTAFARVEVMDRTQGPRVKKAVHSLKAVNDLINIIVMPLDTMTNAADQSQLLESFYKHYVQTDARYKDGANHIFGTKKIARLNAQWENSRVDKINALQALHTELMDSENFVKIIGSCFGNLFDFNYEIHGNKPTAMGALFQVTAKHIVVMFRAFPGLQLIEDSVRDKIIDDFLDEYVLKKQGWLELSLKSEEEPTPKTMNISLIKEKVLELIDPDQYGLLSYDEISARDLLVSVGKSSETVIGYK